MSSLFFNYLGLRLNRKISNGFKHDKKLEMYNISEGPDQNGVNRKSTLYSICDIVGWVDPKKMSRLDFQNLLPSW